MALLILKENVIELCTVLIKKLYLKKQKYQLKDISKKKYNIVELCFLIKKIVPH